MTGILKLPKRASLRLADYDYSQSGAYFVTICVQARKSMLGVVVNGEMLLNEYGKMVAACWQDLPNRYYTIDLNGLVVMPNHMHGIIVITGGETPPLQKAITLGQMVGYFKYQSTRKINEVRGTLGAKVWHRGYYEHVIRDEESLNSIREYIATNPLRWDLDRENPQAKGKDDFDRWLATFPKPQVRIDKSGQGNPAHTA